MQPIERVGVFALLFLVVTVVAVVLWDRQPEGIGTEVAAAERAKPDSASRGKAMTAPPQLGQTTRNDRGERSSGASRRTDDSRRESEPVARRTEPEPERAHLPVAEPRPQLTPAPKPARTSSHRTDRHEPANRPSAKDRTAGTSEAVVPKRPETASNGRKTAEPTKAGTAASDTGHGSGTYVVRAGDTLSEIALAQLGTSKRWKEIADLNGVDASQLRVGMELSLPGRSTTPAATESPAPRAGTPVVAGAEYRVREGDSLWLIAKHQLGDGNRWAEIAELNPSLDPNKLVVGKPLVLPAGATPRKAPVVAKNTSVSRSEVSEKPRVR